MKAYYNEFDPHAAAWLRELIKEGHIAPGDVDERDIKEVKPDDLDGYTQCHFFAGIGGWSYALQLAGWPDDRPVWTGSCPCQPFSAAGRNKGTKDSRDLWPVFARLIGDCRPATVFGEQSERAIAFGWLDRLCDDLEAEDYAIGAAVLPACSVGSPQLGQRLYWVAEADSERVPHKISGGIACATSSMPSEVGEHQRLWLNPWQRGVASLGHDGKRRRLEPGVEPLAHGIPARVVRLRGYGNAIVPHVAARFIEAYMSLDPLLAGEGRE